MRCLAALAVMTTHMAFMFEWPDSDVTRWIRILMTADGTAGKAGVSFFFTLSGFLITYLMYQERSQKNFFNVKNFYIRRILRIWPLYYFSLIIGFVIYPYFSTVPDFVETANWKLYVMFLTNFDFVYHGIPVNELLNVQWSIAVEEQFYLVWPWIFILFGARRFFPYVCLLFMLISFLFQVSGGNYYHSLTSLNDLSAGGFIAYFAFHRREKISSMFSVWPRIITVLIYLIGLGLLLANYQLVQRFPSFKFFDELVFSAFSAFVILEQNYSAQSFVKLGSFKLFSWLGRISYGLYLYHMMAIYLVISFNTVLELPLAINFISIALVTVAMSYASYHWLESPFLKLKEKVFS